MRPRSGLMSRWPTRPVPTLRCRRCRRRRDRGGAAARPARHRGAAAAREQLGQRVSPAAAVRPDAVRCTGYLGNRGRPAARPAAAPLCGRGLTTLSRPASPSWRPPPTLALARFPIRSSSPARRCSSPTSRTTGRSARPRRPAAAGDARRRITAGRADDRRVAPVRCPDAGPARGRRPVRPRGCRAGGGDRRAARPRHRGPPRAPAADRDSRRAAGQPAPARAEAGARRRDRVRAPRADPRPRSRRRLLRRLPDARRLGRRDRGRLRQGRGRRGSDRDSPARDQGAGALQR